MAARADMPGRAKRARAWYHITRRTCAGLHSAAARASHGTRSERVSLNPHRRSAPAPCPTRSFPGSPGPPTSGACPRPSWRILAAEIRETIITTVATTGGHLGSSLGVVEIAIALHRLLDSPRDRIVWDTGHQAYAHKLLTGRFERFGTLRQIDGVGGFPRRSESEHDVFDGGHAGTGLSIAEGLAAARDIRHGSERIAVVVGDAALMTGLSLEALNDIGHRQTPMLIVLNDNEMSISATVGAFSTYLSKIKLSGAWQSSKSAWDGVVRRIPVIGPSALMWSQRLRRSVVNLASPGQLFEDLGITYIGVVPGHDIHALLKTFARVFELKGPTIVHVRTQKGRGYKPAEKDQVSFHGAALPPMEVNGDARRRALRRRTSDPAAPTAPARTATRSRRRRRRAPGKKAPSYTSVFVSELLELAKDDERIVAITAGMPTGTGLSRFQAAFPTRFQDVGIAEQHAVTMASGLAIAGMRPGGRAVLDVPPARLRPDRPRRVPERPARAARGRSRRARRRGRQLAPGHVHDSRPSGSCRTSSSRARRTSRSCARSFGRRSRRTTRSRCTTRAIPGFGLPDVTPRAIKVGQAEVLREGEDILFVGFGPIVMRAVEVADALAKEGWSIGVINARFAKPLDRQLILDQARGKRLVVTFEESVVTGGFGSAVLEAIEEARVADGALRQTAVRILGIPGDRFVDHGSVVDLRRRLRLDAAGLAEQVREAAASLALVPARPAPARRRRPSDARAESHRHWSSCPAPRTTPG